MEGVQDTCGVEDGEIREAEAVAAVCVEGFFGEERGQASDI